MYMVHSMSSINEDANLPGTEVQPSKLLGGVHPVQRGCRAAKRGPQQRIGIIETLPYFQDTSR